MNKLKQNQRRKINLILGIGLCTGLLFTTPLSIICIATLKASPEQNWKQFSDLTSKTRNELSQIADANQQDVNNIFRDLTNEVTKEELNDIANGKWAQINPDKNTAKNFPSCGAWALTTIIDKLLQIIKNCFSADPENKPSSHENNENLCPNQAVDTTQQNLDILSKTNIWKKIKEHSNDQYLIFDGSKLVSFDKLIEWEITVHDLILKIDKVINAVAITTITTAILITTTAIVSLISQTNLWLVSGSAGILLIEYLLCGIVLMITKKFLEQLPQSIQNDPIKIAFTKLQNNSLMSLTKWLKFSFNACGMLINFFKDHNLLPLLSDMTSKFYNSVLLADKILTDA